MPLNIASHRCLLGRAPAQSGSVYDDLVLNWAARVVSNGGAEPAAATKQAMSDFCAALRSANLLSKMKVVCCLTPGGLTEALTPLIKTAGGAAYGTELVNNGTFDSGTSGWTPANNATLSLITGMSGNGLQVQGDYIVPNPQARQTLATVAGVTYKLTLYHKQPGAGVGKVLIGTTAGGGDLYTSPDLAPGAVWTLLTVYFTATSTTTYLSLGPPNAGSNYWFDSISCQVAVLCNDPFTNYNFVSSDLTVNGIIGNAASKYILTGIQIFAGAGLNQPVFVYNNAGHTIYCHTTENPGGKIDFEAFNPGPFTHIAINYNGAVTYGQINSGLSSINPSPGTGYYSCNRIGSSVKIFHARSDSPHVSKIDTTQSAGDYAANRSNAALLSGWNGAAYAYSGKRLSFFAAHSGLTNVESSSFYNAIQALRMALGGGYV